VGKSEGSRALLGREGKDGNPFGKGMNGPSERSVGGSGGRG